MYETQFESDRLAREQILKLLDVGVETPQRSEFLRLVNLPSEELVGETRLRLESTRLGLMEAVRLLGASELTMKSWFRNPQPLPEAAHHKLAAVCLLLNLASAGAQRPDATELAQVAVHAARGEAYNSAFHSMADVLDALLMVFGVPGLAAAALYSAITERPFRNVADSDYTGNSCE